MKKTDEMLILVDHHDTIIGSAGKCETHQRNLLHRAFSVFIYSSTGKLLVQKRAPSKYHSGGLWTNTCCGHPRWGEATMDAANRRLQEEMGLSCTLTEIDHLTYSTYFPEVGLYENEYDHIFVGVTDKNPILNPDEAEDFAWIEPGKIASELCANPQGYTHWFKLLAERIVTWQPKTF